MKKILPLLVVLFLFATQLIAQKTEEAPKIKFEKVSEEELAMKTYPNDTTAEAVILYDDGSSYVKYVVGKGFMLTYERFVRIKILKKSGVNWGNFFVRLYSYENSHEKIFQIKGTTINLENGKIVKSELKKDAIFQERQNKYWETVRFSMPSVKVGSVFDLKFSINSDLIWNLRTWNFQYTIPVKWSQYCVTYPEYYNYNQSNLGYHPLLYTKKSQQYETFNYATKVDRNDIDFNPYNQTASHSISYIAKIFSYAAKDILAMKEEPYLTTLDNYTTQIKFELASADFNKIGGKIINYTSSWADIARQLSNDDRFGIQLRANGFVGDVVSKLTNGITDEQKKLDLIYNYVQNIMKWDGYKSIFTTENLKKAYADKTGNSADINLLLAGMLNKAGINAYPVILSTRENGTLLMAHASVSDCNYVIVKAIVNGKPILLDATEPNLQAGFIPFRCLNGEGHLINNEVSETVPLSNPKSIENVMVGLELKDGKMAGTIKERATGLSAYTFRESVKTTGSKKEYFDKLKNSSTELDYLEYSYYNLDSLNLPVTIEYKIAMKEGQDSDASVIYIDPILINRKKNNPFTSPTREYPVDFGVPFIEQYNLQLTIQEGYTVEALPESKSFALGEKGGQFLYQISQVGNKIVLNLRLSIDKAIFLPSEYPNLKEFYNQVINKQAEQIILKKTTI